MQWVRDAYSTLACLVGLPPVPGTGRHLELRYQARREYVEENRKAEGQRDPERVRRLRRRELELSVEECEFNASTSDALSRDWLAAAGYATCCKGASKVYRRMAASCAARAEWSRVQQRQMQEELRAMEEQRAMRIGEVARIVLPERVVKEMEGVAAIDLCAGCHKLLEKALSGEELLRKQGQANADSYRNLGVLFEQLENAAVAAEQQQQPPAADPATATKLQQEAATADSPNTVLDPHRSFIEKEQAEEDTSGCKQAQPTHALHLRKPTHAEQ